MNEKICNECGVNVYALPGFRHAREQYNRLADYCIENSLFKGHDGSHTDSVVREIERLTAKVTNLRGLARALGSQADVPYDEIERLLAPAYNCQKS